MQLSATQRALLARALASEKTVWLQGGEHTTCRSLARHGLIETRAVGGYYDISRGSITEAGLSAFFDGPVAFAVQTSPYNSIIFNRREVFIEITSHERAKVIAEGLCSLYKEELAA